VAQARAEQQVRADDLEYAEIDDQQPIRRRRGDDRQGERQADRDGNEIADQQHRARATAGAAQPTQSKHRQRPREAAQRSDEVTAHRLGRAGERRLLADEKECHAASHGDHDAEIASLKMLAQ
jgi:hypothetical protein